MNFSVRQFVLKEKKFFVLLRLKLLHYFGEKCNAVHAVSEFKLIDNAEEKKVFENVFSPQAI